MSSYRGYRNNTFNHNQNWYDPVARSAVPVDGNGHGTHVTGTVAGGVDRMIGVAPGAKWIHCRIADRTFTPANVIACQQFMLAPHDLDGRNANPDLRPHTTSHSYTCGTCRLRDSMTALHNAGVYVISAAGNSGPRCASMLEPAVFNFSLTVGALGNRVNTIAPFSSRGPAIGNLMKPEIVAPGTSIMSAQRNTVNGYVSLSGTSMAAPHINGVIGLIYQAVPELVRDIAETNKVLFEASNHQRTRDCNSPTDSPNHVYGYGTINVEAAISIAKKRFNKL